MELESAEPQDEATEMLITFEAEAYLREAGKWAHFIGMAGFFFSALTIISSFSVGAMVGKMQPYSGGLSAEQLSSGLSFMYIIFGILILMPSLYLFQFGGALKKGFETGDQFSLNAAFLKLKSCFRFLGIMILTLIVFYIFIAVAALVGGGVKV